MSGVIIHTELGWRGDRPRLYRDSFNCKICGDYVIYMGLDEHHSDFCQKCQDELARGRGMSSDFRKKYKKYLEGGNAKKTL